VGSDDDDTADCGLFVEIADVGVFVGGPLIAPVGELVDGRSVLAGASVRCPVGMVVVGIIWGDWVGRNEGCRVGGCVVGACIGTMVGGALGKKVGRTVTGNVCGASVGGLVVGDKVVGKIAGMAVVCAVGDVVVGDFCGEEGVVDPAAVAWAVG
jgi:hypothetical protein